MKDIEKIEMLYRLFDKHRDDIEANTRGTYTSIIKEFRDEGVYDDNLYTFVKYHYYKYKKHNGFPTTQKTKIDDERNAFLTYMEDHKDYKTLLPIERKRIIRGFTDTHPNISPSVCSRWINGYLIDKMQ